MGSYETSDTTESTATDDALVVRAQSGDDTAFRELFARHFKSLTLYTLKLCNGNYHDAEDIVSETYGRAFSRIRSFKTGDSGFVAYLLTIARNLAIDEHRKRQAHPRVVANLSSDSIFDIASATQMADETHDAFLQRMTLIPAFRALSKIHREILFEIYWRERTLVEVAENLDLPLATAKSRLYYAIKALRRRPPSSFK